MNIQILHYDPGLVSETDFIIVEDVKFTTNSQYPKSTSQK